MNRQFRLGRWILFGLLIAVMQAPAWAQRRGVQAVGLARWSRADIDQLASELVSAGGDLEVAYLPFEFTLNDPPKPVIWAMGSTPDDPEPPEDPAFQRSRRLVRRVLKGNLKGTLTLTTFLYFHNRVTLDRYQTPFRWSAFAKENGRFINNSVADVDFRKMYRDRCQRNATFLRSMREWAQANGHQGKLRFVTVPDLEDNVAEGGLVPSSKQFNDVKDFIANVYQSHGLKTQYRRSSDRRTDGIPLERHGDFSVIRQLGGGDVYSNDGTAISIANQTEFNRFLSAARTGVQRGVTVLYWRQDYNGPRNSGKFPYERGILQPLTNPSELSAAVELAALRRFLRDK